jgi:predicted Zn-dependent peptidase
VSTLRLIFGELARIRRNAVAQSELKCAKDFYTGQMMLAMEDTLDQMLWMGESTTCLDRISTLEEVVDRVRAVSAADIRRAAQKILNVRKANLAVIGPLRQDDIDLQRLAAG